MANAAGTKPTHTAFALKREGRRQQFRKWLEIGVGWQREDGSFQGYIDRTPIGGWTGFVHFQPAGRGSPLPAERPAAASRFSRRFRLLVDPRDQIVSGVDLGREGVERRARVRRQFRRLGIGMVRAQQLVRNPENIGFNGSML